MIRIRMQWTKYRGKPIATFLSFSLNLAVFASLISIFIFISGLVVGDITAILIGGFLVVALIIYFIAVSKHLKNLNDKITLQKEKFEAKRRVYDYLEAKKTYPDFNPMEESKNKKYLLLLNLGYSVKDAYEEIHNINKNSSL